MLALNPRLPIIQVGNGMSTVNAPSVATNEDRAFGRSCDVMADWAISLYLTAGTLLQNICDNISN